MKKLKNLIMVLICLVCVFLIVFITMKNVNPIIVERVDPIEVKAGEDFYIFEGKPTISVYGKGFKDGDIIFINNHPQNSAVGDSGWMTCFVDRQEYAVSGKMEVQVKRINEKGRVIKKSQKLYIVVK
ncbi:hypothetical protein [Niameybacter massiliensis]|uniref:hypothetical protein n=1 Tax=Niameybacter massiliensis TaxID=1658108 RepID=UPI0006B46462|nr:hypothetical protein [Niameybacter massiliensis]